jgi:hypothetical protein
MVTVKQILAAEGDVLSRLLGEVLQPGNHIWNELHPPSCIRCGERRKFTKPNSLECQKPIPLDWDNAMKWRFKAEADVGIDRYMEALSLIMCPTKSVSAWTENAVEISTQARLNHYLQAAAIAKLNAEKGK